MAIFLREWDVGSPTAPLYSSGDGSNPFPLDVLLDGLGGTVTSNSFYAALHHDTPGTGELLVTVEPVNEDAGVVWEVSTDETNWYSSVVIDMSFTYPPLYDRVDPIFFRAIVDNDGTVTSGLKTSCKIRVSY